jgi:ribosome-associated protein
VTAPEKTASERLAERIVGHIIDKKGDDIVILDLRKVTSIADFFVVATGNSSVHVKAIADEIHEKLKRDGHEIPWHIEGVEGRRWILIDYVDVVAHIFDRETRSFYEIEKLYDDAPSRRIKTD